MTDWEIFAMGVFVTTLVIGWLFYIILEFRRMEREPEKYRPGKYGWSEPHKKVKSAA